MSDFVKKIIKTEAYLLTIIVFLDLVISLIYIFFLWETDRFVDEPRFFVFYFSFERGGALVIDILLLQCRAWKSLTKIIRASRLNLFLFYVFLQVTGFIADIIFYSFFSTHFLVDGYLIMTLELVMPIVYFSIYYALRVLKNQIMTEKDG